jgi:2-dehydro-3-deoxyphosphogluconate aldolase / (4S)-4-hydroxy-2-oxoglutarate aldolase
MDEVLARLGQMGLVPVVKIERAEDSVALARALSAGGLPCAEITFRTAAAEESIRRICSQVPDMLVGAGTVLTVDQAQRAVDAGARFIVSPGFGPRVVDWCVEHRVPIVPGVVTPTDILAALERDLQVLKFFPAEAYGGINTIKALAAPFGMVKFMPTGGVSARNLADYLRLPAVHACGGTWMVESKLIAGGQWDEITRLVAEAREIVKEVRG